MPQPWQLRSARRDESATVAIARVAGGRLGLITQAELYALGLHRSDIARLVRDGSLHAVHPRVFAVGHRALSTNGRWLAATLTCGPGSAIGLRTALYGWSVTSSPPSVIDVVVPGDAGREVRAGLRIRRCRSLRKEDVAIRHGVPTTTPARTLLDVSSVMAVWELERTVERALAQRLLTVAELRAPLAEPLRGRKGIAQLRVVLETLHPEVHRTRSELERIGVRFLRRFGLRSPRVNATRGDNEVDLVWDVERVIVELDGYAWHANAKRLATDHRRSADLRRAGWIVLRFTWSQLVDEAEWVAGHIRAALRDGAPTVADS